MQFAHWIISISKRMVPVLLMVGCKVVGSVPMRWTLGPWPLLPSPPPCWGICLCIGGMKGEDEGGVGVSTQGGATTRKRQNAWRSWVPTHANIRIAPAVSSWTQGKPRAVMPQHHSNNNNNESMS